MFTGIISEIGTVQRVDKKGDWIFILHAPQTVRDLSIGASVACSGICLTVIAMDEDTFTVQASQETIDVTCAKQWEEGTPINLERALRVGDELGGHLVSGHVDGIAVIDSVMPENDSLRFIFTVPEAFACFLAPKGSVALDGISLTVNEVEGCHFGINVIPHTQQETTLGERQAGDRLNFEVDSVARYLRRMIDVHGVVSKV
ncbi:MAG: riboflavin synthase [Bdellovibrionales bacterium]